MEFREVLRCVDASRPMSAEPHLPMRDFLSSRYSGDVQDRHVFVNTFVKTIVF